MPTATGVAAELVGDLSEESLELTLRLYADLEGGRRIEAQPVDEPTRLILGLARSDRGQHLTFIKEHVREAYLDPISGDPMAWQGLIGTLGDEGLNCDVAFLRSLPFAVEVGPRLIGALGDD